MPEFFYWTVLILSICAITATLIVKKLYPYLDKRSQKAKSLLMAMATRGKNDKLASFFTAEFGTHKVNRIHRSGTFSMDRFLEELKEEYPELMVLTQTCALYNKSEQACTTIIKLASDIEALVQFNHDPWSTEDSKGRPYVKFEDNTSIVPYINGQKKIQVAGSIEVSYTGELGEFAKDRVLDLAAKAGVETIHYESKEKKIRMYRIKPTLSGYAPVPYDLKVSRQPNEYLDLAYEPVEIEYGGEKQALQMSRALNVMIATLRSGDNIQIYGMTGSGKSRLLDQLCADLTSDSFNNNTVVITLTPSILTELQSASAQASLIENIKRLQEAQGCKIIFLIDEAEPLLKDEDGIHTSNQSLLLQLMAGSLQIELGCSTVLCYNADPKKLNGKAFRKGRTGMLIELRQLTSTRARKLATYLQTHLIERSFDDKAFNKSLAEVSKLPTGETYAAPGEISLADVYASFIDRDKRALIVDMIRAENGLPPLRKKPKTALPVATVAPVDTPVDFELVDEGGDEQPAAAAPSAAILTIHKKKPRNRNRGKGKKNR